MCVFKIKSFWLSCFVIRVGMLSALQIGEKCTSYRIVLLPSPAVYSSAQCFEIM